jgi:hypothetical protein
VRVTPPYSIDRPRDFDHSAPASDKVRIWTDGEMHANLRRRRDEIEHLIFNPFKSPPPAHDKRVVRSKHSDHIDSFRLKLLILLDIRRQMLCVACRLTERYERDNQL